MWKFSCYGINTLNSIVALARTDATGLHLCSSSKSQCMLWSVAAVAS